jgi:hypothetical protein
MTAAIRTRGAVLASRAPRATVAVLVTYTFLDGVDWTGLWIMSAITIGGFAVGALLMQRRDVGTSTRRR